MSHTPIARALLSVSDKTGLVELARHLAERGVELLSTGGSAKKLQDAGLPITEVGDYTGFPEMMDGRVKTLHPKIHGGLLQRRNNDEDVRVATEHDIPPIDLLVVNLYPFRETVAKGADQDTCIENIDIGGPALIRAAAKNHAFVTVLTDPAQYDELLSELETNNGKTSFSFRQQCAAAAYAHTASYDSAISTWFAQQLGQDYPEVATFSGNLRQTLRYGENPHQTAAFYVQDTNRAGVANAIQIQGKELSYNNLNDTDAAFELVSEFTEQPAVAIIKHANPCGVAMGTSLVEAYQKALACDSVSAFGGIIALNQQVDLATAEEISKIFSEVIIAPDIDDDARELLAKKKNLRVLLTKTMADTKSTAQTFKSLSGGFLVQSRDNQILDTAALRCVTKKQVTEAQLRDLVFAFTVAKHVKSNTIVYAKDLATVGIGAGQMSRVDSARIAARKAADAALALGLDQPLTVGSVAASDAFFPFADGLETIVEAGAIAVIQPGGSIRDNDVVDAADKAGIAMMMCGMRHFRH